MDKLRGGSLGGGGSSSGAPSTAPGHEHHQLEQYQYPKNLIEQYLRASSKIKKFERAGFFK